MRRLGRKISNPGRVHRRRRNRDLRNAERVIEGVGYTSTQRQQVNPLQTPGIHLLALRASKHLGDLASWGIMLACDAPRLLATHFGCLFCQQGWRLHGRVVARPKSVWVRS